MPAGKVGTKPPPCSFDSGPIVISPYGCSTGWISMSRGGGQSATVRPTQEVTLTHRHRTPRGNRSQGNQNPDVADVLTGSKLSEIVLVVTCYVFPDNGSAQRLKTRSSRLQKSKVLRRLGKYSDPLNDDPTPEYFQAVIDFQISQNVEADGYVGPVTYRKLRDAWPDFFATNAPPSEGVPFFNPCRALDVVALCFQLSFLLTIFNHGVGISSACNVLHFCC